MDPTLDAATLRNAMSLYVDALEDHRKELDSLNVFPVPDGDTGTNMLLTQRAVVESLRGADGLTLPALGRRISKAALMGARGNSGVILSQILRGFCERYCAPDSNLDAAAFAQALERADEEARKAVARPLEGTILTVLRDAATAALARAGAGGDLAESAEAALEAAATSLDRTAETLPELREAGVVDAGAKGLVLLLAAIAGAVEGAPRSIQVGPPGPVGHAGDQAAAATEYGYEVMYLLEGVALDGSSLRRALSEVGASVVVVGGGDLWSVHVHSDHPDAAIAAGQELGTPRRIRIASLDEEVAARCIAVEGFRGVGPPDDEGGTSGPGIVAVVEGEGLAEIFRSLGATVVRGGPGNNPAVGDLLAVVDASPGSPIYLLPNHRNVVPAAEAAAREAGREVHVVPAVSVPQGIAAALAIGPTDAPDRARAAMNAAAREICSGEIAVAEREATWRGGRIDPGDLVGLSGGEILAAGGDPEEVVVATCRALRRAASERAEGGACAELCTLFVGADATDEEASRVAESLRAAFPDIEVEVRAGGQPRYPYLIGLE